MRATSVSAGPPVGRFSTGGHSDSRRTATTELVGNSHPRYRRPALLSTACIPAISRPPHFPRNSSTSGALRGGSRTGVTSALESPASSSGTARLRTRGESVDARLKPRREVGRKRVGSTAGAGVRSLTPERRPSRDARAPRGRCSRRASGRRRRRPRRATASRRGRRSRAAGRGDRRRRSRRWTQTYSHT